MVVSLQREGKPRLYKAPFHVPNALDSWEQSRAQTPGLGDVWHGTINRFGTVGLCWDAPTWLLYLQRAKSPRLQSAN